MENLIAKKDFFRLIHSLFQNFKPSTGSFGEVAFVRFRWDGDADIRQLLL